MTKAAKIDDDVQIDPAEWAQSALFDALNANEREREILLEAWQRCAPNTSFNDFVRVHTLSATRIALQTADRLAVQYDS